ELTQPIGALRSRIGVEENSVRRLRQLHSWVHHPAGIVFVGLDLDKMLRLRLPNQIHRAVRRPGINHDQFPVFVFLCLKRWQSLAERPALIAGTHDDAHQRIKRGCHQPGERLGLGCTVTSTNPTSGEASFLNAAWPRSMMRPCRTNRLAGPRSVIVTSTLRGGEP